MRLDELKWRDSGRAFRSVDLSRRRTLYHWYGENESYSIWCVDGPTWEYKGLSAIEMQAVLYELLKE